MLSFRLRPLLFAGLAAGLLAGCSRNIISPPARAAELESPAVLPRGAGSFEAAGGLAAGVFYVGVGAVDLRARRGLGDGLEGNLGVTGMAVDGSQPILEDDWHPYIGTVHGGLKWNPPGARWLGLLGGFGLGASTAGMFAGPEAGFVLGYENPFLVPYLGGKLNVSVPFRTRSLDLGDPRGDIEDPPDPPGYYLERARTTIGSKAFGGLKLHPRGWSPDARAPSLVAEIMVADFTRAGSEGGDGMEGRNSEGFFGIFAGLEFPFGGPSGRAPSPR